MTEEELASTVLGLLRRVSPRPIEGEIPLDRQIGPDGIGLDSIARVELLAEIDLAFGVSLPVALVADGTVSAAAVIAGVAAATART